MTKVIKSLSETNYNGSFQFKTVQGSFNADGNKNLYSITGSVPDLGSFDASGNGDSMSYSLHYSDTSRAAELAEIAHEAVAAVQAELAGEE